VVVGGKKFYFNRTRKQLNMTDELGGCLNRVVLFSVRNGGRASFIIEGYRLHCQLYEFLTSQCDSILGVIALVRGCGGYCGVFTCLLTCLLAFFMILL
jgi:hypothetical protein